jgi:hypothetical protein
MEATPRKNAVMMNCQIFIERLSMWNFVCLSMATMCFQWFIILHALL